jgi:putative Mg2+ transporter-C (MgtC) family protein
MKENLTSPLMIPMWYSIICGALIGLEREIKNKDAGIKTSVFICIGACIYTFISTRVSGVNDTTRVIAQIVSGVGFLGAGVIIYEKDKIKGLTSAAIIWMTAAIGIACGLEFYFEAIMASLTIVFLDYIFDSLKLLLKKRK